MINLKMNLILFKLRFFLIIFKSRILKKKLNLKYKDLKKNFENYLIEKEFTEKWFLNNFEIFNFFLPEDLDKKFSYLEIGSFEGLSALNVLFNFKNCKVTTIDLWKKSNINSESLNVNFDDVEKKFNNNLKDYEYNKIKKDSVIAMRELLSKKVFFDVIYIDGSHNGEDIISDAIEGYKLLNKNGIMIFDDIVNENENISIQSHKGFEKFCELYNKKIKLLYLKNIAVVKKLNEF